MKHNETEQNKKKKNTPNPQPFVKKKIKKNKLEIVKSWKIVVTATGYVHH